MSTLPGCFSFHVSCFMTLLGTNQGWKWVRPQSGGAQNGSVLQGRHTGESARLAGIFPYVCGPPFHLYLPVHLQTFCYHQAGSGPALHKVSTTSKSRVFPHLLAVAKECPVFVEVGVLRGPHLQSIGRTMWDEPWECFPCTCPENLLSKTMICSAWLPTQLEESQIFCPHLFEVPRKTISHLKWISFILWTCPWPSYVQVRFIWGGMASPYPLKYVGWDWLFWNIWGTKCVPVDCQALTINW
jgi:hypothetical protein